MKKYLVLTVIISILFLFSCKGTIDEAVSGLYVDDSRENAIGTLKKYTPDKAFEKVSAALQSQNANVVDATIEVLRSWDHDITVPLLNEMAMTTPNQFQAKNALRAIGESAGIHAEDVILKFLYDERTIVQVEAINQLGVIGSKKALPELIGFLNLENIKSPILPLAILSISRIKDESAIEPLIKLLDSGLTATHMKFNILKAIAEINENTAYDLMVKEITSSNDPMYLSYLLDLFAQLKNKEIIPALEKLRTDLPGMAGKINSTIGIINQ